MTGCENMRRDRAVGRRSGRWAAIFALSLCLVAILGAADEPGLEEGGKTAPVPLYREEPAGSSSEYLRRLGGQGVWLAGGLQAAQAEPLLFNLALAWQREGQNTSAAAVYRQLQQTHPRDFALHLAAFQNACAAGMSGQDLAARFEYLGQLSAGNPARGLARLQAGMDARVPALNPAVADAFGHLGTAEHWFQDPAFRREASRRYDAWLALLDRKDLRAGLWRGIVEEKLAGTVAEQRDDHRRLFAVSEVDAVRAEAQQYWAKEGQREPAADAPAGEAGGSAALDHLRCLQEALGWAPDAATELALGSEKFPALVLACKGTDRSEALAIFRSWSQTLLAEPAPFPWAVQQLRRTVAEAVIADAATAGPALLAAGDTLVEYVEALNHQPAATRRPDARLVSELTVAAVVAFDRAHKAGTPVDCRGLKAVIRAIAISGEDPDVAVKGTPRYRLLYDFLPLLKDPATAEDAARLFREFKAGKLPAATATLWTLDAALKQNAPGAVLESLLTGEQWTHEDAEALLAALPGIVAAAPGRPSLALAAARLELQFYEWDRAAGRLQALAALEPAGVYAVDLETAGGLLQAVALQEQLPAEAEPVLAAACRIAPIDSALAGDCAQALCRLRMARGDRAGAAAALQAWWTQAPTAASLAAATQARLNWSLVQRQDLVAARQLLADLQARLPKDPVARWSVLQPLLATLAQVGARAEFTAVIDQELAAKDAAAALREALLQARGDELQVQGDAAGALAAYAQALATLAAKPAASGQTPPASLPTAAGLWARMTQLAVAFPAVRPAFEAAAAKALEPADTAPTLGRQVAAYLASVGKSAESVKWWTRMADERPWDLPLHVDAAQAANQAGDRAMAVRLIRAVVAVDPGNLPAWLSLLNLGVDSSDAALTAESLLAVAPIVRAGEVVAQQDSLQARGRRDLVKTLWAAVGEAHKDLTDAGYAWLLRDAFDRDDVDTVVRLTGDRALRYARENVDAHLARGEPRLPPAGKLGALLNIGQRPAEVRERLLAGLRRALPKIEAIEGNTAYATAEQDVEVLRGDLLRLAGRADEVLALPIPADEGAFAALAAHYQDDTGFLVRWCDKVIAAAPDYLEEVHRTRAMAYERMGQRDKLFDSYQWLVAHAPAKMKTAWRTRFAELLLSRSRWQEALEIYTQLDAEKPTATVTMQIWKIRRDHPVKGQPAAAEWLQQTIEAARKPELLGYRRELANRLRQDEQYAAAETLQRTVVAEAAPADHPADLQELLNELLQQKRRRDVVTLLEVEATTGASVAELRPHLTYYLDYLQNTDQFTAALLQASPFLKALPPTEVWTALVAHARGSTARMVELQALKQAAGAPEPYVYGEALLQSGLYDAALAALAHIDQPAAAPETWPLGQLSRTRRWRAAELLRTQLPEFAAGIYAQLAKDETEPLNAARLTLAWADCLVALGRLDEAGKLYASRGLLDPVEPGGEKMPPVPASLQETWRHARFIYHFSQRRDPAAAAMFLPLNPGLLAADLRGYLVEQARAAGHFREALQVLDPLITAGDLRLADDVRWNWILDLVALSADPGDKGAAFRQKAFQLALDGYVRDELSGRRAAIGNPTADQQPFENGCRRWLYLLRSLVRADGQLRADLETQLWSLCASQPQGDTRVTRTLLVIAGDQGGNEGRLAVLNRAAGLRPLASELQDQRLGLLRVLKHTDELLDWHRQAVAEHPEDRDAWLALVNELRRVADEADEATAVKLEAELTAAADRIVRLCDRTDAQTCSDWAGELAEAAPSAHERLMRAAAEASPQEAYAHAYAAELVGAGRIDDALQVKLQALFVREWRAREGRGAETPDENYVNTFVAMWQPQSLLPAVIAAVEKAQVTAVSPRHRAVLALLLARMHHDRGDRAQALAAAQRAVAVPDQAPFDALDLVGRWYGNWGWHAEAGELYRAQAAVEANAMRRGNQWQQALAAFEAAKQPADAASMLEKILAAAGEQEAPAYRIRLAGLYRQCGREVDAEALLKTAMDAGSPSQRYAAWNAWRQAYLNMAVAADRARVLHDFPAWVDQMESLAERNSVVRDYSGFLESQQLWREAARVNLLTVAATTGYERQQAAQLRIRQLVRAGDVDAAGNAGAEALERQWLSTYQVGQELRPLMDSLTSTAAVEFYAKYFLPLALTFNDWNSLLSYGASDWRKQNQTREEVFRRLSTANPAEIEFLGWALRSDIQHGDYDLAFGRVKKALAPAQHPNVEQIDRVILQLRQQGCLYQVRELLAEWRAAAAAGAYAADKTDLDLAELDAMLGRSDEARATLERLRTASAFALIRNQATRRLFDFHLQRLRTPAAAEALYLAELQRCPVSDLAASMLPGLMGAYRQRADLAACRNLVEQRLKAGYLYADERDSLTLDLAQMQIDEAAAAQRDPLPDTGATVLDVFRRRYLKQARELDDRNLDALYSRSRGMLLKIWSRGKSGAAWKRAEPALAQLATAERPGSHRISDLRLELFRRREDREAIVAELQARAQQEPEDQALHNQWIQACVEAKQFAAAANLLKQDADAHPTDFRPAFALVDLYLAAGQAEQAGQAFAAALKLAPKTALELDNLGHRYEERRRYDWALELYRRRQAIQPDLAAADNLARLAERMEQPLEAVKTYLAYYDGLFRAPGAAAPAGTTDGLAGVDLSWCERMTPYARNERDFEAALTLVKTATAKAPTAAQRAFLTLAMADMQYLRRRQTEALQLYATAAAIRCPGRGQLIQYLFQRLPDRKGADQALALGQALLTDVAFTQEFSAAEQAQLLRAYAGLAGTASKAAEQDAAWTRLIASAPAGDEAALRVEYAEVLRGRKAPKAAAEQYRLALKLEKDVSARRRYFAGLMSCLSQARDLQGEAMVGDELCAYEKDLGPQGNLDRALFENCQRWLALKAADRAAQLLTAMADSLNAGRKRQLFNQVSNTLINGHPQVDVAPVFTVLQTYLPAADAWRLDLVRARRLGRTDPTGAQQLFDAARQASAEGPGRTAAEADSAQLELLRAEIEILLANRRAGQAARLWQEALNQHNGNLPGGDHELIRLFMAGDRADLAAAFLTDILKAGDAQRIRGVQNDLYNVGYALRGSKNEAAHRRFEPVAEAALVCNEPNAMRQAAQIWVEILAADNHYDAMVQFATRALEKMDPGLSERRYISDTAFSALYRLVYDDDKKRLPRPADDAVVGLVVANLLPALDDSAAQFSASSISAVLEKMHLTGAVAARIKAEVEQRSGAGGRPIAAANRAGNLVQQILQGQTAEAVRYWETALAGNPPNFQQLEMSLRDGYRSLDQRDTALKYQTLLLALNPWDIGQRIEIAALLTELKRDAAADEAWQQAVTLASASENELQQIGDRMVGVGRYSMAIPVYSAAYEMGMRRGSISSWQRGALVSGLVRCEWQLGDREKAYTFWNQGLQRIARRDGAHDNLIETLVNLLCGERQVDQRVAEYEARHDPSGPDNPNLRYAFGLAYERLGDERDYNSRRPWDDKALRQMAIAADLLPQERRIRDRMINIYGRRNDYAAMIAQYREIARNDPKNIECYERMGDLYGKMGKTAEREKAWSMILEARPRDGEGHRKLAEIYTREKMFDRALVEARAVVDNRPEDPASYTLLGNQQRLAGDFVGAIKTYQDVLARAAEWQQKRYWPNEWQNPSNQGLFDIWYDWVGDRLNANDSVGAADVRRQAHQHAFTVDLLRSQKVPPHDREYTAAEWMQRVQVWNYLEDQLPAPTPVQPAPPEEFEPPVEPTPVEPPELPLEEQVE